MRSLMYSKIRGWNPSQVDLAAIFLICCFIQTGFCFRVLDLVRLVQEQRTSVFVFMPMFGVDACILLIQACFAMLLRLNVFRVHVSVILGFYNRLQLINCSSKYENLKFVYRLQNIIHHVIRMPSRIRLSRQTLMNNENVSNIISKTHKTCYLTFSLRYFYVTRVWFKNYSNENELPVIFDLTRIHVLDLY